MPGARKSRHSRQVAERRDRFGKRKVHIRAPLPIVALVCDDTHTAPEYFGELKRQVKRHVTVKIVKAPCQGASPRVVVQRAVEERRALSAHKSASDKDVVWAAIDVEGEAHRQCEAESAASNAPSGVRVAISYPCYEVWTLLHLEDTGALFNSSLAVLERVGDLWTCPGLS